jgi:hypothetical protein
VPGSRGVRECDAGGLLETAADNLPHENDAKCGFASRAIVQSKHYIFTAYPRLDFCKWTEATSSLVLVNAGQRFEDAMAFATHPRQGATHSVDHMDLASPMEV